MIKGIYVEVDIRQVVGAFEKLKRIDTKKILLEVRGPVRWDQGRHYRDEASPDMKWPRLAASTIERRRRPRGINRRTGKRLSWPKRLMGRFPTALQTKVSTYELVVLSRVKRFSLAHQQGATVGRGSRLPRRQFLWVSPWLLGEIKKRFEEALNKTAGP